MLPRSLPARALTLLFAAALLWAQMLGLAHAVLHGPQAQTVASGPDIHAPELGERVSSGSGLLQHLLGHADRQDAPDCKLWDQLGQTTALLALPLLHLPQSPIFYCVPASLTPHARDLFAPYGARAPPKLG